VDKLYKKVEISIAGYYLYLEPIFTILVAPLFIGNQLTSYLAIEGTLIFIGLVFINQCRLVKKAFDLLMGF
jgi:drug/metabolite transporter (DMT)-like permease